MDSDNTGSVDVDVFCGWWEANFKRDQGVINTAGGGAGGGEPGEVEGLRALFRSFMSVSFNIAVPAISEDEDTDSKEDDGDDTAEEEEQVVEKVRPTVLVRDEEHNRTVEEWAASGNSNGQRPSPYATPVARTAFACSHNGSGSGQNSRCPACVG